MTAVSELCEQATEACWQQWQSLVSGSLGGRARSMLDPEALVLASLALRQRALRLADRAQWWARSGASLLSVQRLTSVLTLFPESLRSEAIWFARECLEAGDHRWKKLAAHQESGAKIRARPGKGPRNLVLRDAAVLLVRLRAGFGVGVKADLLAYLLGESAARSMETWVTARRCAEALSYSVPAVRRAAGEMVTAGFVEAFSSRPVEYTAHPQDWMEVLHLPPDRGIPPWRYWAQIYAFVVHCDTWQREYAEAGPVVRASRARDLVDSATPWLHACGIRVPDPLRHPGENYGLAFEQLLGEVASWISRNV